MLCSERSTFFSPRHKSPTRPRKGRSSRAHVSASSSEKPDSPWFSQAQPCRTFKWASQSDFRVETKSEFSGQQQIRVFGSTKIRLFGVDKNPSFRGIPGPDRTGPDVKDVRAGLPGARPAHFFLLLPKAGAGSSRDHDGFVFDLGSRPSRRLYSPVKRP